MTFEPWATARIPPEWIDQALRHPTIVLILGIAMALPVVAIGSALARWLARQWTERAGPSPHDDTSPADGRTTVANRPLAAALIFETGAATQRIGLDQLPFRLREHLQTVSTDDAEGSPTAPASASDAVIAIDPDLGYVLWNLSPATTIGVRVNGDAITSKALSHGDRIDLGRYQFRFEGIPRAAQGPATATT